MSGQNLPKMKALNFFGISFHICFNHDSIFKSFRQIFLLHFWKRVFNKSSTTIFIGTPKNYAKYDQNSFLTLGLSSSFGKTVFISNCIFFYVSFSKMGHFVNVSKRSG